MSDNDNYPQIMPFFLNKKLKIVLMIKNQYREVDQLSTK